MRKERNFELFSDEELAHAIELMIPPEELRSRSIMIALLKAAEFSAKEVREQICDGEQLFDGPSLSW